MYFAVLCNYVAEVFFFQNIVGLFRQPYRELFFYIFRAKIALGRADEI